jgi:hypothetical protein
MADKPKQARIRIELTAEQKEQVREATGLNAAALELTAEELEERVAPTGLSQYFNASGFNDGHTYKYTD